MFSQQRPARIYVRPQIFTPEECQHMIGVAESASAWTEKRHSFYPTDDFPLSSVPEMANVTAAVEARVLPLLRRLFGVRDELDVFLDDLFLIRYSTAVQSGLKMHIDSTTLSFSVALSDPISYTGGGIEFELLDGPIRAERGSIVAHPSKLHHKGADVKSGLRYVLVGFVGVGGGEWVTYGSSPPGSPELMNGLWAICLQVVTGEAVGLPSGVSEALPTSMTDERCYSKWYIVARQLWAKHGVVGEGIASLWEDGQISDDGWQLLMINGALLLGSMVFIMVMS